MCAFVPVYLINKIKIIEGKQRFPLNSFQFRRNTLHIQMGGSHSKPPSYDAVLRENYRQRRTHQQTTFENISLVKPTMSASTSSAPSCYILCHSFCIVCFSCYILHLSQYLLRPSCCHLQRRQRSSRRTCPAFGGKTAKELENWMRAVLGGPLSMMDNVDRISMRIEKWEGDGARFEWAHYNEFQDLIDAFRAPTVRRALLDAYKAYGNRMK